MRVAEMGDFLDIFFQCTMTGGSIAYFFFGGALQQMQDDGAWLGWGRWHPENDDDDDDDDDDGQCSL